MTVSMKIEGLEELTKKLKSVSDLKYLKASMRAAGETLKGKIAKYPPASSANNPSSGLGRWYERGLGTHYIRKRDGGISVYKTSQTLGRKWTTTVKDNGLTVEVGNNVTYGPYVQDREKQAYFHAARGWLTIQDVVEQEGEKIAEQLIEVIKARLEAK